LNDPTGAIERTSGAILLGLITPLTIFEWCTLSIAPMEKWIDKSCEKKNYLHFFTDFLEFF
jgi:hypothetical protein